MEILVSALSTAGITLAAVFVGATAVGFALISRRRRAQSPDADVDRIQQEASILLVRVDDAVQDAEAELGYAIAQFGEDRTRQFAAALDSARGKLREAFALQHRLDDAYADTVSQRRDWSSRILSLCIAAQQELEQHTHEFDRKRALEQDAPRRLSDIRSSIDATARLHAEAVVVLGTLRRDYAASAIASVTDNLDRSLTELAAARSAADAAQSAVDENSGTAADSLRSAEEHSGRADELIDAVGTLRTELERATAAVTRLTESTQQNLAEARGLRDAPPDPDSSSAVAAAISEVEAVLSTPTGPADPMRQLERLRQANASLDASMAGARNQQRRLDGARTALAGALVQAHSQLSSTRDFIATRRGGVGAAARTRLAEAERKLMLAENEADPVAALDLARNSLTHSRDADALARYDLMHRA